MSISFYILLLSNGLIILLNTFFNGCIEQNEVLISGLLITLIGIPHGAIDHLLFIKKTNRSQLFFYSFYLFLIVLYVLAWVFFPLISLALFLILSAYHFGQSQFEHYDKLSMEVKRIMGFFWGTSVLSFFVLINFSQISDLITQQSDFNIFTKFNIAPSVCVNMSY
jgi:Brp/Blh family beta-carotene 15,15'-monooxygenase